MKFKFRRDRCLVGEERLMWILVSGACILIKQMIVIRSECKTKPSRVDKTNFTIYLSTLTSLHEPYCFLTSLTNEKDVGNDRPKPMWPDLTKFWHFGKMFNICWQFLEGLFSVWHSFRPTLADFKCRWANGQNLAIWSHWPKLTNETERQS